MSQLRRPDPEPLKTNDTATFLAGTGLWVVALLALLVAQPAEKWWIWTCAAGIGLGLFGVAYVRRRDSRRPNGSG